LAPGANPTTSEFTNTTPALKWARVVFIAEEISSVLKACQATRGLVNFYNAGVVHNSRLAPAVK
jgi:hypothetical protein